MPEGALTSFTVGYMTHIAILCGSGIIIEVTKYVMHRIFNNN